MPFAVGQTLGRYRILASLGAGGMGDVYRAHDSRLDRDVAVKLLKPAANGPDATAAIMAEARAVSALSHAHVCTLHEVDEVEGHTFLVMELVEGETLASLIASRTLSVERVVRYASQIASALAHAHHRGVVHCDLKSANAMVTPEGSVKVLDFGIARRVTAVLAEESTRSVAPLEALGVVAGTLAYMAPERVLGAQADERGDLWALGIVIFEMLTGRRPFQGHTAVELTSAIVRAPLPELPPHVPAGLRAIVHRCLAKEPGARYQRAGEVVASLEAVTASVPPIVGRRALTPAFAGAIALSLAAVGVIGWATWSRAPSGGDIDSLVVLPFTDLTPAPESEYLADGVTDAVITELGQLGALRVTSRTSSMRYRDSKEPIQQIAHALGVDAVLEGSLFRDGGRIRVTARLVDAATDSSLWTGSYERETPRHPGAAARLGSIRGS